MQVLTPFLNMLSNGTFLAVSHEMSRLFYGAYARVPGEVEFLDVWHEAYAAIMRYSRGTDGFWVGALLCSRMSVND